MTTPSPAESASPPSTPSDGRFIIGAMIGGASMVFLLTAALLYYRWASMSEPSSVIIVETSPALKGAEVSVDHIMLSKPLKATVGEKDRYAIPFYVDPGEYDVKVIFDGQVQHERTVTVTEGRGWRIDLTRLRPTTMPALDDSAS